VMATTTISRRRSTSSSVPSSVTSEGNGEMALVDLLSTNKTDYEDGFFGVLYTLSQAGTCFWVSPYFLAARLLLDFLQIVSFPLQAADWSQQGGLHDVWNAASLFQGQNLFALGGYRFFLIVTALISVIVIGSFSLCMYVGYYFKTDVFSYAWPLQLVWLFLNMFGSVFYVSILSTFFTLLNCQTNEFGEKKLVKFADTDCWGVPNAPFAALAIVVSLLLGAAALAMAVAAFDANPRTPNLMGLGHTRVVVRVVLCQTGMSLTMFLSEYPIWREILLLACSSWMTYVMMKYMPYYHGWVNWVQCGLYVVVVWVNIWSTLVALIAPSSNAENAQLALSFVALIGIPFAFVAGLFLTRFRLGRFHGLKACRQRAGDSTIEVSSRIKLPYQFEIAARFVNVPKTGTEQHIEVADTILQTGAWGNGTSAHMHLAYSNFLLEVRGNVLRAANVLNEARKLQPDVTERFAIFSRDQDAINRQAEATGENGVTGVLGGFAAFTTMLDNSNAVLARVDRLQRSFWRALTSRNFSVERLADVMQDLNETRAKVEEAMAHMLKRYHKSTQVLRLYGRFLDIVRMDPEVAVKFYEEAARLEGLLDEERRHRALFNVDLDHIDDIVDRIVTIDRFGAVVQVTARLANHLGYADPSDLQGRNISCICPPPHSFMHDSYLKHYHDGGKTTDVVNAQRIILAQHASGLTIPIKIFISNATSRVRSAAAFVARVVPVKGDDVLPKHIAAAPPKFTINSEGLVISFNKQFLSLLGAQAEDMEQMTLASLIPELASTAIFNLPEEGSFRLSLGNVNLECAISFNLTGTPEMRVVMCEVLTDAKDSALGSEAGSASLDSDGMPGPSPASLPSVAACPFNPAKMDQAFLRPALRAADSAQTPDLGGAPQPNRPPPLSPRRVNFDDGAMVREGVSDLEKVQAVAIALGTSTPKDDSDDERTQVRGDDGEDDSDRVRDHDVLPGMLKDALTKSPPTLSEPTAEANGATRQHDTPAPMPPPPDALALSPPLAHPRSLLPPLADSAGPTLPAPTAVTPLPAVGAPTVMNLSDIKTGELDLHALAAERSGLRQGVPGCRVRQGSFLEDARQTASFPPATVSAVATKPPVDHDGSVSDLTDNSERMHLVLRARRRMALMGLLTFGRSRKWISRTSMWIKIALALALLFHFGAFGSIQNESGNFVSGTQDILRLGELLQKTYEITLWARMLHSGFFVGDNKTGKFSMYNDEDARGFLRNSAAQIDLVLNELLVSGGADALAAESLTVLDIDGLRREMTRNITAWECLREVVTDTMTLAQKQPMYNGSVTNGSSWNSTVDGAAWAPGNGTVTLDMSREWLFLMRNCPFSLYEALLRAHKSTQDSWHSYISHIMLVNGMMMVAEWALLLMLMPLAIWPLLQRVSHNRAALFKIFMLVPRGALRNLSKVDKGDGRITVDSERIVQTKVKGGIPYTHHKPDGDSNSSSSDDNIRDSESDHSDEDTGKPRGDEDDDDDMSISNNHRRNFKPSARQETGLQRLRSLFGSTTISVTRGHQVIRFSIKASHRRSVAALLFLVGCLMSLTFVISLTVTAARRDHTDSTNNVITTLFWQHRVVFLTYEVSGWFGLYPRAREMQMEAVDELERLFDTVAQDRTLGKKEDMRFLLYESQCLHVDPVTCESPQPLDHITRRGLVRLMQYFVAEARRSAAVSERTRGWNQHLDFVVRVGQADVVNGLNVMFMRLQEGLGISQEETVQHAAILVAVFVANCVLYFRLLHRSIHQMRAESEEGAYLLSCLPEYVDIVSLCERERKIAERVFRKQKRRPDVAHSRRGRTSRRVAPDSGSKGSGGSKPNGAKPGRPHPTLVRSPSWTSVAANGNTR